MTDAYGLPPDLLDSLRTALGAAGVLERDGADADAWEPYETDASGTVRGNPLAVLLPHDRDQLSTALRLLHAWRIPVVPRGAGTGLAGGAVADGAVLLCTSHMRRIFDLDPVARTALVEPGVTPAALNASAARHGLRYLPDPASGDTCTIGGNVAVNAGGPRSLRYGVTGDHVLALDVALAGGDVVRVGRGEDGGLDLGALFIGSEGTLGVVAAALLRLEPLAAASGTVVAGFGTIEEAGDAVWRVLAAGVVPAALELMDGATLEALSAFAADPRPADAARSAHGADRGEAGAGVIHDLPEHAAAALIVECEGEPEEVSEDVAVVARRLEEAGGSGVRTALRPDERERLWRTRRAAYHALARLGPDVRVQDAAVPRTALPHILPEIQRIARRNRMRVAVFAHAGDGNLHPNLVFDRRDPDEAARADAAAAEIMRMCVDAGGSITGEHGVGIDKVRYMPLQFGPVELEAQERLRRAFDPGGRMNPGKVLSGRTPRHGALQEA